MFKSAESTNKINCVAVVEGRFICPDRIGLGPGTPTNVELTFVYSDSKDGTTYGTCPVQITMLSTEAIEALAKFLELSERDFGHHVFNEGIIIKPTDEPGLQRGLAETPYGLRRPLGG